MWPLYAFDNYFKNTERAYTPTEQWDLLKSLGYDQAYLSLNLSDASSWNAFLEIPAQRARTGLGLAAVYTVVDFTKPPVPGTPSVRDILAALTPGDTLELALSCGWKKDLSDPRHDEAAAALLAPWLALAQERGVTVLLYHHFGFWLERIEDCVRLTAKINHPALRVTFCGYHWYACDRANLAGKLRLAAPWLRLVNLCGARPAENFAGALPATIDPVGEGDFPLAEFIAALRAIGYAGPVGFQGYKIEGRPKDTLARSVAAFRAAARAESDHG